MMLKMAGLLNEENISPADREKHRQVLNDLLSAWAEFLNLMTNYYSELPSSKNDYRENYSDLYVSTRPDDNGDTVDTTNLVFFKSAISGMKSHLEDMNEIFQAYNKAVRIYNQNKHNFPNLNIDRYYLDDPSSDTKIIFDDEE